MKVNHKFSVFILTYGRPDNVKTYKSLKNQGYTGDIYLICSDDDKTLNQYLKNYGEKVIVFNKDNIKCDTGDNFGNKKIVVYARNAIWNIARDMNLDFFLELDDDYISFDFKIPAKDTLLYGKIQDLDKIFGLFIDFLHKSQIDCIAVAQGGDYIGGIDNNIFESLGKRRKIMNSFFCNVKKPFYFYGSINEDVNTYTFLGSQGKVFLTHPLIAVVQAMTQQSKGGLTDFYLEFGTYVKSFYSILFMPSAVKIRLMGETQRRLHHEITWKNAVPVIINEKYKKKELI